MIGPFVIRHGIDDLRSEQASFGCRGDWDVVVPAARDKELELLLRMDRALRVAKDNGSTALKGKSMTRVST